MMTLTAPSLLSPFFPYGTTPVDPALTAHYEGDYSDSDDYPLPAHLPVHHPMLTRLEGIYPLTYTLPPWWLTCVAEVEPPTVRPLLASLSPQEFRTGCLDPSRWKAFRERLTPEERRLVPGSPKLAAFVEGTSWLSHFQDRGAAEIPEQLSLLITTRPLDFLYMSNGRDWRSCQHYRDGAENHRLPGNFYDTGVALAMVLVPGTSSADAHAVLVRTTLRVFFLNHMPVVVIGRTYHNHATLAFLLLIHLAHLLDDQSVRWGLLSGTNTHDWCQYGYLGDALRERMEPRCLAQGERCWFPWNWHEPYVDGNHSWTTVSEQPKEAYRCMQLDASIHLLSPHSRPPIAAPIQQSLDRLRAVGLCAPLI